MVRKRAANNALLLLVAAAGQAALAGPDISLGQGTGISRGTGNSSPQSETHGAGSDPSGGRSDAGMGSPGSGTPAMALRSAAETDQDEALDAVRSGSAIPLSALLAKVAPQLGGTVLDAKLLRAKGTLIYQLKVLSQDGRTVKTLYYDARSGKRVGAS